LASASEASPAIRFIEIPFEFHHRTVLVQAKIDGKGPYNMLLDTGVDPSVVDLGVARALNLAVATVGEQGSGGGSEVNLAYETRLPSVALGELIARDVDALATDLSKVGKALGKPVHAVLGYSLLKDRIVQIDYPRRVVRFYSSSPFSAGNGQRNTPAITTLKFRYESDVLVDDVLVNGRRVTANLDTGSDSRFQLTPKAVAELGLEGTASAGEKSTSTGFNGQAEHRIGKIANITIGGVSVDAPEVVFYGKGTGHDDEAWGVRIGNSFLQDFIVTIDYANNTLTLQRP
jgi:predicted aspartyl protease